MVRRGWLNRPDSGIRARDVVISGTLLLLLAGIGGTLGGPARANASSVFAVDTAADSEDGSCGIAPQPCSLRDAIEAADAQPGPDSIAFDATVTTPIEPATPLPDITDPVAIDGSMAGGVVIDGSDVAGMGVNGLHVTADGSGSTIQGLEIRGFSGSGILLDEAQGVTVGGLLEGDPGAAVILDDNGLDGIAITGDATAVGNDIIGDLIYGNGQAGITLGGTLGGVGCPISGTVPGPNGDACSPSLSIGPAPVSEVSVHVVGPPSGGEARAEVYWSATCQLEDAIQFMGGQAGGPDRPTFLGSVDLQLPSNTVGEGSFADGALDLANPLGNGFLVATATTSVGTSTASQCVPVAAPIDRQISLDDAPLLAPTGQPVAVDLRVANAGPSDDSDPVAEVDLSATPAADIAASTPGGRCIVLSGPAVACQLAPLGAHESAPIQVDATFAAEGTWSIDAAVLDLARDDTDPLNDEVTLPLTVGGTTQTGSSVEVDSGGTTPLASVTFDNVGGSGQTSITTVSAGDPLPGGYVLPGGATFVDIHTTAVYSGPITVCLSSTGASPAPTAILHDVGGAWHDITTLVDTAGQRICGQTTTLSPFVLAENAAPGPPLAVSATGGIGSATVSWSPPASSGSSPISGYTITSSPGGTTIGAAATASSVQVNGLTAGTSYTFTVEAVNASGIGAPSLPSGPVIPTGSKKQTVSFASISTKTMLQSPLTVSPTASSGLPVTLTSSTTPVCNVTGFSITFVMAGSCTVTATQAGSTIYAAATPVTRTFTISLAAQTVTFASISTKTMLQSPLTVSPTASSGLPVTLTSSTTPVCTVSGFTITFAAAGSCTVTAAQPGNATYAAAASLPRTFAISKVNQTVTFTNPGTQTLANTPLAVSATATSGLTVVFTTSTPTVCTAGGSNGSSITLLVTGSCSVTASQAGNAAYNAASQARTFSVTQATQAITFPAIPTASLLQVSITMSATASSGLPVSYTTSTATVCTAGGTNSATITLLKAGSCRVVASQAGNATYKAAANQAQTFSVIAGKLAQTISFAPLATRSVSQPPEALTATASSGLPVTLSTSTPTTCTLGGAGGNVLTLQVTGTCTVTASQAGNRIYLAAQSVTQSFTVTATGFVVANGTQLSLNGQPFPIFGASIYETSNNGATADPDQVFGWATQAHLNTLRLIDTFDEDGTDANAPYEAADWSRTDGLIARAQAAGLHVTIDFSDFRNWWVDRQVVLHDNQNPGAPVSWAYACANYALGNVDFSALDPYSVAARPAWTAFMTYVANRANTVTGMPYRNDPTILVVSMAGEPWGAGSSECGEATSEQELTDFYAWALGEWKSLDPNHLRSNGGLTGTYAGLDGNGHPIPSGQQIDGLGIFDLADNTLPSLHTYPPAGTEADGQTPVLAPEAQRLGKPWFTEEFGWPQGVGDEQRAAYYAWAYGEQGQYGSAGSLFWNLGPQVSDGTYDVDPSTPLTWQVVLDNAPGP